MHKFKGLMSSLSCEWSTPQWLFDELDKEFHFDLDVCATARNAKCVKFLPIDALDRWWGKYGKIYWMNPPYGREIIKWVRKAYIEGVGGATSVCLLPSRTDTKWWHNYVMKAEEIRFIKGRLKFNDGKGSAPFPSCIVIFR